MYNTNLIYQKFNKENSSLSFPYPPLYTEDNTDYICFCSSSNVSSKFWKVCEVDNFSSSNIQNILNSYQNVKEILPNQLLTGPLFTKKDTTLPPFITIPSFYELTDIVFNRPLFVPTKDSSGNYLYKKNPVYTDGPYNGRPLLLTIGVPVSNQIQTIDNCLSHVKPILEQLDSELIVIDTGSTDGTIEVCKNYGARIITFPWCNNMSAARNEGIYHAKGAWYLSIDDDEWFEDTSEIIKFFQGGLYQFYDSASYIQRNYHQFSGKTYSDHHTVRMARITPELHFEGRIHDALVLPPLAKQYQLSCYAHHYGFIHATKEHKLEKYRRNVSLLLYDILEYPDDLRYNYQLANEFHVMDYKKEAMAYYLRGILIGKETPNSYYEKTHAVHLISLLAQHKSELLFSIVNLLKDSYSYTIPEQAFISYVQAETGIQADRKPDEILFYLQTYRKYYDIFQKSSEPDVIRSSISMDVCNKPEYRTNASVIAFCIYCQKNDDVLARMELENIEFKHVHSLIKIFCCHFIKASDAVYYDVLQKLPSTLIQSWKNDILYAFIKSFDERTRQPVQLFRFRELLSGFTVAMLDQYISQKLEDDISPEVRGFLCNAALSQDLKGASLQELYFFSSLLYGALGKSVNPEDNIFVFKRYVTLAASFAIRYYHPNLLGTLSSSIPSETLAAYYIYCALTGEKDVEDSLETAALYCPEFSEEISALLNELKPAASCQQELIQLSTQLKNNALTLLSLGKKAEASQLLSELLSLCPEDTEIKELLQLASK